MAAFVSVVEYGNADMVIANLINNDKLKARTGFSQPYVDTPPNWGIGKESN